MHSWLAPTSTAPIHGQVSVPGSKSITNRALILAAQADRPSTLMNVLRSRDTDQMMEALCRIGVAVEIDGTTATVSPTPVRTDTATAGPDDAITIDAGMAGTILRFLPPLLAARGQSATIDGDPSVRARPQAALLDALRELGVAVDGDTVPFTLNGTEPVRGGELEIDASGTSQFVSGLLLSAAGFTDGISLRHTGSTLPSSAHIEMTLDMLRTVGVRVSEHADPPSWRVEPGPVAAHDWVIEPDLSNATVFLAAAAATGGSVTIGDWNPSSTQPGVAFIDILAAMGASSRFDAATRTLTVTGPAALSGVTWDLNAIGELTPTVAALATLAQTPSTLGGIAHLRGHETDRLAALAENITALGGRCTASSDALHIEPAPLHGGTWKAFADHRIATAGAIVGLRTPSVTIDDIDSTAKTMPEFARLWTDLVDPS